LRPENKLVRLVAKWAGEEEPTEDLVTYPDDFSVRELRDELDIAMQLSLVGVPEMIRSEQMKNVVEKLFPAVGRDLIEKLRSEVDKWAKDLKEKSDLEMTMAAQGGTVLEEARRNRDRSGSKQSDTKSREEAA